VQLSNKGRKVELNPQVIINIITAIVLSGIGWFGRQVWDAVNELRKDLHQLEVDLPKNYTSKDDFSAALKEINAGLQRIYDKLDGKADKL
jgi:Tfp pilus assembly protein PilO